jgi:hypothetical protein
MGIRKRTTDWLDDHPGAVFLAVNAGFWIAALFVLWLAF